jgi:hypothetical protein
LIWTTVNGVAALEAVAGWRVLSSQLPGPGHASPRRSALVGGVLLFVTDVGRAGWLSK